MIEVTNRRSYYDQIIWETLIVVVVFILFLFFKPSAWWIEIMLFGIIEMSLLSQKFTQSICIDSSNLNIKYLHFFDRKQLTIPNEEVDLRLHKTASFRSPGYFVLEIKRKKRIVYKVDSRNGFEEADLRRLENFKKRV